jgi:hypothetical protein
MNIPYRQLSEYQPVDVARLRPGSSYKDLLARSTHPIDEQVRAHGQIPPELLMDRTCPTCGSTRSAHELDKDHLRLVRCNDCDLVYVSPTFDEAHYREVYASRDYQDIVQELGVASHEYRVQRFGEERVRLMQPHVPVDPPRYLDIGCSTGFVVEAARDAGWAATGIAACRRRRRSPPGRCLTKAAGRTRQRRSSTCTGGASAAGTRGILCASS